MPGELHPKISQMGPPQEVADPEAPDSNSAIRAWTGIANILTVDVEDWQQSTLDLMLPVSERVVTNTLRLLAVLSDMNVKATMFVQGMVAEKFPELVRKIVEGGHELASHGYSHTPLFKLTPHQFEEELDRSVALLEGFTDQPIRGFRAPDFSITEDTFWARQILVDRGFTYSSSVFPFGGHRYGIAHANPAPHVVEPGLLEIPLTVVRALGRTWPVAGGGYLRLLPYRMTRWAIHRVNGQGRAAVIYLHPYEFDLDEVPPFRPRMSLSFYLSQTVNRRHTETKLRSLGHDFRLVPISETLRP